MSKDGGNAEAPPAEESSQAKKDAGDIYENRGSKKLIRLVTVMAYMFSVSFVAIVLSAYYLFLWEPPNPRLIHRAHRLRAEPRIEFLLSEPGPRRLGEIFEAPAEENRTLVGLSPRIGEFFGALQEEDPRKTLEDSLARLRLSLIQDLRARANGTRRDDSVVRNSTEPGRIAGVGSGSNFGNGSSKINSSDDNALIPATSAISGEEAADGRTTVGPESSPTASSSDDSSSSGPATGEQPPNPLRPGENRSAPQHPAFPNANDSTVANIYGNQAAGKTWTNPSQPPAMNSNSTMREINKWLVNNRKDTEILAETDFPRGSMDNATMEAPKMAPAPESGSPPEFPGRTEPASVKSTNLTINSEDTHAARLATKAAAAKDDPTGSGKARDGWRVILKDSWTTPEVENASSTVPSAAASEGFQNDSTPVPGSTESSV